jgi:hypothetical protein
MGWGIVMAIQGLNRIAEAKIQRLLYALLQ